MSVELLDIIYGAFIPLLHATAESGLMVFHWSLSLIFSNDYMEKVHSKREQDKNENESGECTRRQWRVDGTVSHHLRFSYVGRCELYLYREESTTAYCFTEACTEFVVFCFAGVLMNIGICRDDALPIVRSLLCAGSRRGNSEAP